MALTITNSLGVARGDLHTMVSGALGCNLAWGLIDAAMYLMTELSDRGRAALALRGVREATGADEARRIIAEALPPVLASVLRHDDLDIIRQRLSALAEPPDRPRLVWKDWLAAVGVFLIVFLSTLPLVLPFAFIDEIRLALRVSNGIAIAMMFASGYALGRHSGQHPWKLGLSMVMVGIALTGIAIALGG
jgi:VIT1/CCC1 family predicted Fe2+/Mn2+ transporter